MILAKRPRSDTHPRAGMVGPARPMLSARKFARSDLRFPSLLIKPLGNRSILSQIFLPEKPRGDFNSELHSQKSTRHFPCSKPSSNLLLSHNKSAISGQYKCTILRQEKKGCCIETCRGLVQFPEWYPQTSFKYWLIKTGPFWSTGRWFMGLLLRWIDSV